MKNNKVPKKVTEMHFDALTLVKGQYAGKSHVPVNPAAEIIGVKSGTIDEALANLQPAPIQAALEFIGAAKSESAEDSAQDAVDSYVKSAALSAFYSALYSLEWDCSSVLNAPGFDSDARKNAIELLLSNFQEQITELSAVLFAEKAMTTETAVKAGARHSAADKQDIQDAHDKIGKAKAALDKAHEATSRLLTDKSDKDDKPAGDGGKDAGEKSGVVNDTEQNVDEATKAAIIEEAKAAAKAEVATEIDTAVKAAVEPLNTELTATKSALDETKTALETANKSLEASNAKIAELDTANKSLEKQIADTISGARERSAAGGHTPANEAQKSGETVDTTAQTREALKENPNMKMASAISMILHGANK